MTIRAYGIPEWEGLYWELEHKIEHLCFELECMGITQPGQRLVRERVLAMLDRANPGFAAWWHAQADKLHYTA